MWLRECYSDVAQRNKLMKYGIPMVEARPERLGRRLERTTGIHHTATIEPDKRRTHAEIWTTEQQNLIFFSICLTSVYKTTEIFIWEESGTKTREKFQLDVLLFCDDSWDYKQV